MSKEIIKLEDDKDEKEFVNKIVLASTWNINCGIATYTKYLFDSLNIISPNSFKINPINQGEMKFNSSGKLTHLQHEYGIIPKPLNIRGKLIITWHTVSKNTLVDIKKYESNYDVLAHIIHSKLHYNIESSKDIFTIPHGSIIIPEMKKDEARRSLGININMPIGFVFGFQSRDKNYKRLIDAAKNTGIHLIISGAPRISNHINFPNDYNVTFINRFLTENEVNLYALASDILLFDYFGKEHYSVSGAMHRIIGAGRPVICSDVRHFIDIKNNNCIKFKDRKRLEESISLALENSDRLSHAARNYAEKTSWNKIARKHIEVYKRYVDI